MTKLLSILAVSILAAACAKQEGERGKPAATDKATEAPAAKSKPATAYSDDRSVALVGKLAGVYEAAGKDCAKLAAGIEAFAADHREEVRAANAWKATLSPEQVGALDTRYANELGIAQKMMPGAAACVDHDGVAAALKTLSLD